MLPAYSDIHIANAVVNGLRRHGMDVVRGQDRGKCGASDDEILAEAAREGRLLLTNDEDFLALHAAWRAAGRDHAGIVYWRQNRYPIGEVIRRIVRYATNTSAAGAANTVKYL